MYTLICLRFDSLQFSAGLAENYVRVETRERYRGALAESLLDMTPFVRRAGKAWRDAMLQRPSPDSSCEAPGGEHVQMRVRHAAGEAGGNHVSTREDHEADSPLDDECSLATEVTVDVIMSTHRVWLGTGGEPDR